MKVSKNTSRDPFVGLGRALRLRRKDLGLTMKDVAATAGVSVGLISQIERSLSDPSIGSLRAISGALGMPIAALIDHPFGCPEDALSRFRFSAQEMVFARVSNRGASSSLHAFMIDEPPGQRAGPQVHGGEEFLYVMCGEIAVECEGSAKVLLTGQTAHFDSTKPHVVWNHTQNVCRVFWCSTVDPSLTGNFLFARR